MNIFEVRADAPPLRDATPDQQRSLDDAALIARIKKRDEAALLDLYDRYQRLLMALALRIVGDRETAEE